MPKSKGSQKMPIYYTWVRLNCFYFIYFFIKLDYQINFKMATESNSWLGRPRSNPHQLCILSLFGSQGP